MKSIRTIAAILLLCMVPALIGCGDLSRFNTLFPDDWFDSTPSPDTETENTPVPTLTPTEVPSPSATPNPVKASGPMPSWATMAETEDIASGVESAASIGLLSAVSVYCAFSSEGKSADNSFSFSFGFSSGDEKSTSSYLSSAGSGVIYWLDKSAGDAYIVTNFHVVYNVESTTTNHIADAIKVFLYGSEQMSMALPAEYVGGSMYYDLAVLHIRDSEILRSCQMQATVLANSDSVAAGQTAIAIGNPEARGISVSSGIVSVESETLSMIAVDDSTAISQRVIRIDTAVNSGNSGGGLYNDAGCLIGIVNAKYKDTSVENIGYAIPSNIVRAVTDNILSNCLDSDCETMQRAYLGITAYTTESHATYDRDTGKTYIEETVTVNEVNVGSAAEGVLEEDDILKSITVDGEKTQILRRHNIVDAMLTARLGSVVELEIVRDGKPLTVSLEIRQADIESY